MKYRVTTKVYSGGEVCGPCKLESVMEDFPSAYCVFDQIDSIMHKLMGIIIEHEHSEHMEDIEIITEMVGVDGDGWEDLSPVDTASLRKILTYPEYEWEENRKESTQDGQ